MVASGGLTPWPMSSGVKNNSLTSQIQRGEVSMSSVPKSSETEAGVNGATNPGSVSGTSHSSKGRTAIAGAMATALVTLCFLLLFWNRFLGLRSGDGGFTGGLFFLKGILPYRDYYCPVPPLFIARCAAVLAIFGKLPIILRGFAVFERVILSLLLYGWLVRFFRVKDAALAALVTMVVSTGDHADPVSSYNHFTILLAIASGLAASYSLDEGRTKRVMAAIGSLAGVLSLLCLATKQTIGLGVTVAIPFAVGLCLMRLEGTQKAIRFLAGFVAGWFLAAGALLSWMAHFGILRAFLTQAFVTGPAAKASHPDDFLVRTLSVLKDYWWAALIGSAVLLIGWGALRRSEYEEKIDTNTDSLTFSVSHNIDTVPDTFAKEEADRLLRVRPAVLIYGPQSEQLLRSDEEIWRNGKPSGQRDLIAAVETLAREYKFVRMFRLYPFGAPVYVFVRPDKVGASATMQD
jgi:hypothetical protein